MNLVEEARRKGKRLHSIEAEAQGVDVVRNLDRVFETLLRVFVLEQEEIRKRRLGTFDLRRKQRFLTEIHIDEQVRVRDDRGEAVKPRERGSCFIIQEGIGPS